MATSDPESSVSRMSAATKTILPAKDWAEPGIGPSWRYRFFYWMMRIGGRARGYHLASMASAWYVLFYPSIRRRCGFYLRRRFPDHTNWIVRLRDAHRLVNAYGATLVDMLVLPMFGRGDFVSHSRDHERFMEISSGSKGFVLVLGHVGCWQVGMSALGVLGKEVSVVMIPEPKAVWSKDQRNYRAIDPRNGLQASVEITEALLRGGVVAMMGDRTFGSDQSAVPVQFLGGTAHFPTSPYRMASATGVPVLVMTAPRVGRREYEVRLEAVIDVEAKLGRNAQRYAGYAQQYSTCMEQFVEAFPYQFFNFYDLWAEVSDRPKKPG